MSFQVEQMVKGIGHRGVLNYYDESEGITITIVRYRYWWRNTYVAVAITNTHQFGGLYKTQAELVKKLKEVL